MKDTTSNVYIYALLHPDTLEVRYIGQTTDPSNRLRGHLSGKAKSYCGNWVRQLLREGKSPIMEIVDFSFRDAVDATEAFWIRTLRGRGYRLTNVIDRASANPMDYPHIRAKISASLKGHGCSAETRAKIRTKNLGRVMSAEARANIVASHIGKKHSPEWKANMARGIAKAHENPEYGRKLSDAIKRAWLNKRAAGWWALSYERCQVCNTTAHRHIANGLCVRCYNLQYNERRALEGFPVCTACGRTDRRIAGQGMCVTCWGRERYRAKVAGKLADQGRRWSRNHDACIACGLTRMPHRAQGKCTRCYNHERYHALPKGPRPLPAKWSRAFDACVLCGQTTFRHIGHGKCVSCFEAERRERMCATGTRNQPTVDTQLRLL